VPISGFAGTAGADIHIQLSESGFNVPLTLLLIADILEAMDIIPSTASVVEEDQDEENPSESSDTDGYRRILDPFEEIRRLKV
jgi:hypothetical protein